MMINVADEKLITTVVRSSEILEYIALHGPVRPAQIAADLDFSRSNVHRLIKTLEQLGFVDCASDGSCFASFALFELGNTVPHSRNLIDPVRPAMLKLAQTAGHTVNYGILDEDSVLFIDKVDPPAYLKLHRPVGSTGPLYATSLGKVLLAFQDAKERERIISSLEFVQKTEHTICDPEKLRRELEEIRERSIAYDHREMSYELHCMASPLFDEKGRIRAAISISGVADRFTRQEMQDLAPKLLEIASSITISS